MKWIKTAIGAVIAISVVPLVVLSVINIKKSLETEEVTITLELYYSIDDGENYIFDHYISNDVLIDFFEKGFTVTKLYDYTNDINITITNGNSQYPYFFEMFDNNSVRYYLLGRELDISMTYDSIYNVNATDIDLMDVTFSRTNVNLVTTLLPFISIIFVGGVVLYIFKPFKKD